MKAGDTPQVRWRLGRRPALDGLRGVAILLVLAAHVTHGWLQNFGSSGVTVFFALSGFLITALLLDERGRTGRISLARFYGRRARRLLPALGTYLAVMVALSLTGAAFFHLTVRDVLPVVFYVQNWVMALTLAVPTPVAITWSLSVEEQFYLLWPLVLVLGRRWPRLPAIAAALGVVIAVVLRLAAWDGSVHAGLLMYYRTDTRMDSLLVGCLLAIAVKRYGVPDWARRLVVPGLAMLTVVLVVPSLWLHYVGEPLLAAAATVMLIAASLAGGNRWLSWAPLRWCGRRSYALYLWHYPLVALAWGGQLPMWLAVVLAFGLAEASCWIVERPFQQPNIGPRRTWSAHPEEVDPKVCVPR